MPGLIARCGRLAGVDLLPHLDRLGDPVFRAICEEASNAGVALENDLRATEDG